jgi:hypothetical protein
MCLSMRMCSPWLRVLSSYEAYGLLMDIVESDSPFSFNRISNEPEEFNLLNSIYIHDSLFPTALWLVPFLLSAPQLYSIPIS